MLDSEIIATRQREFDAAKITRSFPESLHSAGQVGRFLCVWCSGSGEYGDRYDKRICKCNGGTVSEVEAREQHNLPMSREQQIQLLTEILCGAW